jgi:hypothetical protein
MSPPLPGLERGSGADAAASLACYYPLSKDRTLRADRRLTAPRKAEYKWWPDGYEPLYYVVTPRVRYLRSTDQFPTCNMLTLSRPARADVVAGAPV